jgi:hypothetical protein
LEADMQFFRDFDKAIETQRQVSADDTDWLYVIVQTNNPTPTWVIEVREEDGSLLGCL